MAIKEGSVINEGANLRYFSQGTGPLFILIPGGGGGGLKYTYTFPVLSKSYTAVTYDRRQNSNSTVESPKQMNIAQQVRDVVAVMKALGFQKTSIMGHSGGGIIALQMVVDYPELLENVILHEVPTTVLLPDSTGRLDRAYEILDAYNQHGQFAAMKLFAEDMVGIEGPPPSISPEIKSVQLDNMENFFRYEYLQFTIYCPDMRKVKEKVQEHGVKFAVCVGDRSTGAFYARTMDEVAGIMGCEKFIVPGSHFVWDFNPDGIATGFKNILEALGKSH